MLFVGGEELRVSDVVTAVAPGEDHRRNPAGGSLHGGVTAPGMLPQDRLDRSVGFVSSIPLPQRR